MVCMQDDAPLLVGSGGSRFRLSGTLLSGSSTYFGLLTGLYSLLRLLRVAIPSLTLLMELPLELVHLRLRDRGGVP